ncbi:hypothetical protein F4780DRAFT_724367 [Xylariomycetidae sp. FL0641]|nr:hypothetical protein F4780DRAFT_724367 [Xylariomycetidae sp. FL0641]
MPKAMRLLAHALIAITDVDHGQPCSTTCTPDGATNGGKGDGVTQIRVSLTWSWPKPYHSLPLRTFITLSLKLARRVSSTTTSSGFHH